MNYGLFEDLGLDPRAYIRNPKVPYIYYNESGNWEKWLPAYEAQAINFETNACTVFASLNQIETLHKFLYGDEPNYSERFNAIKCGLTGAKGQDPQKAHESIRKDGTVPQVALPAARNLTAYFDPSSIIFAHTSLAEWWLSRYDYKHEWLWDRPDDRPSDWKELLKDALKTSPIAVSVSAWNLRNGEYISEGNVNNHYCLLYKIEDDYMYVYDTYSHEKKKLARDHNIRRAKRIWLNKKTQKASQQHVNILTRILNRLTMKKTFLEVCKDHLGVDVTPLDVISDDVACAETVTTLMKKVGYINRTIAGTWTLFMWLRTEDNGFREVTTPEPGDIVISPTGSGTTGTIGHVGVVMENGLIASNNSFGPHAGKFTQNYTHKTWNDRYGVKQRMVVKYYRKV